MSPRWLRMATWVSAIVALAALGVLAAIDRHLRGVTTPLGIVSYELCAYGGTCDAITASWQGRTRDLALFSLGFDYLFMVAYPAAISLVLWRVRMTLPPVLRGAVPLLAGGIWLAGALDAIENYHLFQLLAGGPGTRHAWPATCAATIKFLLIVPALAVCLVGGVGGLLGAAVRREVGTPRSSAGHRL